MSEHVPYTQSKSKSASVCAPATFKPRKVKKAVPDGYRDRAAERRVGDVNEYADVSGQKIFPLPKYLIGRIG